MQQFRQQHSTSDTKTAQVTRDPRKSESAPVAEPAVLKTPPVSATAPRSSKIEAPPGAAAAVDD